MASIVQKTPLADICITERDDEIIALNWANGKTENPTPLLKEAARQILAYFAKELQHFDLPLAPSGNEFQQNVYRAMSDIPYGETRTYGEIAKDLGSFGQPVGQACGSNPIPIIIPCHRVLSAKGLGGFSGMGGVETKIQLLQLEDGYPFLL